MRIEIRGRHTDVTEQTRQYAARRFRAIGRQVSELATLEIELTEEPSKAAEDRQVAEATLYLKRVTLRARETSADMRHSIHLISEDLARQVERHREKRRKRRRARRLADRLRGRETPSTETP